MTRYQNHAGFHVSLNKLQLVEVNNINKQFVLENIDEEYYSDFFTFKDKETKFIAILQNVFNELTFRKPITSQYSSFTLSSTAFQFFDLPYDEALTKKDLDEHVKWELSVLMPGVDINNFAVQTVRFGPSAVRKSSNMLITLLPKNVIVALNKFCVRNNLKLRFIDNEHFSSNNLLGIQKLVRENEVSVGLLIRENYFSISLLDYNLPVYFSIRNYNGISELVSNISDELTKLKSEMNEQVLISKSFLFGDYYSDAVIQKINDESGLAFQIINPFESLPKSEMLSSRLGLIKNIEHFSSAAGIAYRLV